MGELGGRRVLVTGGGGFVGAPTVRALLAEGAVVRVLDVAEPWRLAGVECETVIGDISDPATALEACRDVELVVHLAVLPLNLANADPRQAFESNVRGSFNVFDAAGRAGVRRVVYSSASSAYGPTDAYPIVEDQPLRPNAFYPASKAAAEMLLRGLAGTHGYGFVILRYMNVYGPGQTAGVVPAVARSLLAGERPKLTGDGTQAFDFVHIEDCARANMLSIRAESSGAELNVGSGTATSLNDLVATMAELLGLDVAPVYEGPVSSAPPRVGSIERARALVGYRPTVSLRDGLASVLEAMRTQPPGA
ncbi:MAG TPA: NAD-dependent epimerase/dehydratase family protein [Solirubrobacteraceae bacterium]|nr:NAD-dependent epimerase/dehydratase family protein [Solirubrobacteraceae bacterium]